MAEVGLYYTQCGAKIEPNSWFRSCFGNATLLAAHDTRAAALTSSPRPTFMMIVSILNTFAGIGILFLTVDVAIGSNVSPSLDDDRFTVEFVGVLIPMGILHFVLVYELLKGRSWDCTANVVLSIITIVLNVISIAILIVIKMMNITIEVIISYYFFNRHVRRYYGKTVSISGQYSGDH